MNLSVLDVGGGVLIVPNFTLAAEDAKGRRPGFDRALEPGLAKDLFLQMIKGLGQTVREVKAGEFGASMRVELVNDGPVTFILKEEGSRAA